MNDPTDDEPEDSTDTPEETNDQPEKRKPRKLSDAFTTSGAFANFYSGTAFSLGKTISDEIVGKFNRQIAAALRPNVPSPNLYLMNFKYRSPLQDIAENFNKAMRAQWAPVFESIQKLARSVFPENWGDVQPPSVDLLESILVDEGIPLMWVPGPEIIEVIFKAADAPERRRIIGRRWRGIAADCESVLNSVTYAGLEDDRDFALDCVRALREGHTNAAQALAANLLDSVLRKCLDKNSRIKVTKNDFKQNGTKFDLDDYMLRVSFTFAPVWCAHVKYRVEDGDKIPSTYGRHPSAHAVSRTQYKRVNAVLAIMVVTSVIKFFDIELARRDAKTGK